MASILSARFVLVGLIPVLLSVLAGPPLLRHLTVIGVFRQPGATVFANPDDAVLIDDTIHCEDIHYYAPGHTLFAACQDDADTRFSWFPPLATFDDPVKAQSARGSFHVIDPETKKSQRLEYENFDGPFITHGIDVIADPEAPGDAEAGGAVYFFAVNHVPNPDYALLKQNAEASAAGSSPDANVRKSDSLIDVFYHRLGSGSVRHVRSVRHALVTTPNDILALSPTEFYVTNDHHYLDGPLRMVEDLYPGARWTDVVHVRYADGQDPTASVALSGIRNSNGFGRGRTPDEVVVTSAGGGVAYIGKLESAGDKGEERGSIRVAETVLFDSVVDNPSYFVDPHANATFDASGIVLAGLCKSPELTGSGKDPAGTESALVWYAKPQKQVAEDGTESFTGQWEKRAIFEDDGQRVRVSTAAVLVPIDPAAEGGARRGWLFVAGFLSKAILAAKVEL